MPSLPTRFADSLGRGLVAGIVGTLAMTASSTIEMKIRGRGSSGTPANAASKVLGIDSFKDEQAHSRFGQLAHYGYGTSLGVIRGLLDVAGLSPRAADVSHFAAVYGGEQVMLPALDVAPPATEWGAEEIAIDAWHHLVYVVAAGWAYRWLGQHD